MEYSCINNSCFNVLVCNSNICVSIGLVLMDILIIAYVFLSGNFWVDATHYMHFTLLCAGYYFIAIRILELCSGVQLSYIGITWSFCVLLLWFLSRRSWTVVSLVLIMPHCEARPFWVHYSIAHDLWVFSICLMGRVTILIPVWAPALFLPTLLNSFNTPSPATQPLVVSLCACADHSLAENTGVPLHSVGVLPFVQLSSLLLSSGTLAALVCLHCEVLLLKWGSLPSSA